METNKKKLHNTKKKPKSNKKSLHRSKKYKNAKCSPDPNKESYSCYNKNSLLKLKKYWNLRHKKNQIKSNDPKEIWNSLKENMNSSCNRESCWLRSKFMEGNLDTSLLNYTFAPKAPEIWNKNPNQWLTSIDIQKVMKQYENYYKCFEFLGPSPIDFDYHKLYGECIWEELCKFNLSDMIKRNKNKIGIIFNTDPHNKSGEHWIAQFIDIKKKIIVFFDSNGDKPPKEIEKLTEKIINQGNQLGISFTSIINEIEHQKTDSECGMYCLYFIVEMLKDKDPNYFLKSRIPDKEVFDLRSEYFNKENE
tara:strand:+ start:290 stop:1207 length:918 start_codon:yes stop_codon:yes gene_type:complete